MTTAMEPRKRVERRPQAQRGDDTETPAAVDMNPVRFEEVPIDRIRVWEGGRRLDEAKVSALIASISEVGLLQPIAITEDYDLVFGAHRLEACRLLGRRTIRVIILDLNDLERELAEIDENIERRNLTVLETATALARRKAIYEVLHPETKAGHAQAAGSNRAQGHNVSDKMSPTFSRETAAKIGKTRRTAQRLISLGEKLDPEAAQTLVDTDWANSQTKLTSFAKLPPEKQREIATQVAQGTFTSFEQPTATNENTSEARAAKQGLKCLQRVVKALEVCGILGEHQMAVKAIRRAFEERVRRCDADGSDQEEEIDTWES